MRWRWSYQEITTWEQRYCPVSPQICVCHKRTDERCHESCASPIVHVLGRSRDIFVKHRCKVNNQIWRDCVESHPLAHLTPYEKTDINSRQISVHWTYTLAKVIYFFHMNSSRNPGSVHSKQGKRAGERERGAGEAIREIVDPQGFDLNKVTLLYF